MRTRKNAARRGGDEHTSASLCELCGALQFVSPSTVSFLQSLSVHHPKNHLSNSFLSHP